MFSKVLILLALVSTFAVVNAQDTSAESSAAVTIETSTNVGATPPTPPGSAPLPLPTSPTDVPPCILNCTATAAVQNGCDSVTNLTCVCTSQAFQAASLACITSSCSPAEQAGASALQSALCANSGTPSNPPTAPGTASTSGAASATPRPVTTTPSAPVASSPATTSNAATILAPFGFSISHAVGAVGVALAVVGGATTLF